MMPEYVAGKAVLRQRELRRGDTAAGDVERIIFPVALADDDAPIQRLSAALETAAEAEDLAVDGQEFGGIRHRRFLLRYSYRLGCRFRFRSRFHLELRFLRDSLCYRFVLRLI